MEIELNSSEQNQSLVATIYNNIGLAYYEQERYAEALVFYEKALAIQLKVYLNSLPPNHPLIATAYQNLSMTHFSKSESECFGNEESDHIDFTHQELKQTLDCARKTLPINSMNFPSDHHEVIRVRDWIGALEKIERARHSTVPAESWSTIDTIALLESVFAEIETGAFPLTFKPL